MPKPRKRGKRKPGRKKTELQLLLDNRTDATRFRGCEQKRKYASREEAQAGWQFNVYHCAFCGNWHRTTQRNRKKRKG